MPLYSQQELRDLFRAGIAAERAKLDAAEHAPDAERLAKIEALAVHGATEGERDAARAALSRIDPDYDPQFEQDLQDEADYEDALAHGEA